MAPNPHDESDHNNKANAESQKKSSQHESGFRSELTNILNYVFVEHWLGSGIFMCAMGLIAYAVQTIFIFKPIWWGCFGIIIIAVMAIGSGLYLLGARSRAPVSIQNGKHQESTQPPPIQILSTNPPSSTSPVTNQSPSQNAPTKLANQPKKLLDVSPEYLCGFFKNHLSIQAQKLIAPYFGQWIKVTGLLSDISDRSDFLHVTLVEYVSPGVHVAFFFEPVWRSELERLKPGDKIMLIGQIDKVQNERTMYLDNCELLDA